ncbi:DUF3105 domain-containing protein [Nocardioides sp. Arc9.136]|uniref:DUF3105 domain-containing protein n=1 Tax=Nocardioides sp. Arc9.136 TaxID=2996826 RepID=UPI0026653896|nr:DUF3105 domain-containing protein [Nocardioides sp. Arc9.136]WKN50227.1 DUF3105 domain-containing protein [Nocardioides sp. Arc9.136]
MSEAPPEPPYPSAPPSVPPPAPEPEPASEPVRRDRVAVLVLAAVAAVAVLVVAIGVPLAVSQLRADDAAQVERNLEEVAVVEGLRTDHTSGDVTYPQTPPAGGPHDPRWLECGVYDEPVREENAVHDLEHGTVWITYDPDLAAEDVDRLVELLPDNGILSPYPGLPAPVVVTVWGHQLRLVGAEDPRLPLFVERLGGGQTAPEPFASCAGGLRDPQGGTESPGTPV